MFGDLNVKYYSVREVSAILRISPSTAARALRNKVKPFDKAKKIGRRVIIPCEALNSLEVYQPNSRKDAEKCQ